MRPSGSRFAHWMHIGLVSVALLSVGLRASSTYALPATEPPGQQQALDCLGDVQGTLSSTPQPVAHLQDVTLHWNVTVPRSCTGSGVTLYVDNRAVSPTGSRSFQAIADTSSRLHAALPAVYGGATRTLATAAIKVTLPSRVTIPPIATSNANSMLMKRLLLQALRFEENTNQNPGARRYIIVENNVELDLSGLESIQIVGGVSLLGRRTAREKGPRLYTATRPESLFVIEGNNVRISGLRIEGPDHPGVVRKDGPESGTGIKVVNTINVVDALDIEIDNNEIYGWNQAAVRVEDCDGEEWCPHADDSGYGLMPPSENPHGVRIHNNYIHHNQRQGGEGYGVVMKTGAYALIERNVFDWNRHAIAADGKRGTGYAAYRNLVLENGGYHDTYNACDLHDVVPDADWDLLVEALVGLVLPSLFENLSLLCFLGQVVEYDYHTHQFDVHGTRECLSPYDCGDAGHSTYIRHNAFLYTRGAAIKLRGTPERVLLESDGIGMFVTNNVFAHDEIEGDSWVDTAVVDGIVFDSGAVAKTEQATGLYVSDNQADVKSFEEVSWCDFDGDGIDDLFLATGQTWWYSSKGTGHWVYLNSSTKRRHEMTLGYFDGDNRCDVSVNGLISSGGTGPLKPPIFRPIGAGGVLTSAASVR